MSSPVYPYPEPTPISTGSIGFLLESNTIDLSSFCLITINELLMPGSKLAGSALKLQQKVV